MKKLDLNALGVEEMSGHEMKKIDGGFVLFESSGIFYWVEMWGGVNDVSANPTFWNGNEYA